MKIDHTKCKICRFGAAVPWDRRYNLLIGYVRVELDVRDKLALIGALTVFAVSLIWLFANYYLIDRITVFGRAHHDSAMHQIVHIGLIAVMIFIEWWVGLRMLRFQAIADFAAWFQRRPWLQASFGPTSAVAVLVVLLATIFFAEWQMSPETPSKSATIIYKFGTIAPFELHELQVLGAICVMTLLVRMYAWLLHADEIHLNADTNP